MAGDSAKASKHLSPQSAGRRLSFSAATPGDGYRRVRRGRCERFGEAYLADTGVAEHERGPPTSETRIFDQPEQPIEFLVAPTSAAIRSIKRAAVPRSRRGISRRRPGWRTMTA